MTGTENYFAATQIAYVPGCINNPPFFKIASTPNNILLTLCIKAKALVNGINVTFKLFLPNTLENSAPNFSVSLSKTIISKFLTLLADNKKFNTVVEYS